MKDSPVNDFLAVTLLAVFAVALLIGGWCVAQRHQRLAALENEVDRLRGEIQNLQIERDQLASEGNALENNPLAWEAAIRERLGYTRKGEVIIRTKEDPHS